MSTSTTNLTGLIKEHIEKAQQEALNYEEIFNSEAPVSGKNEFLFFIKPEITLPSATIELDKILEIILQKIDAAGLGIQNIKVLSSNYLEQYNIIAQHYGVINSISNNAMEAMSQGAKEKFASIFGKNIEDCTVLGGFEFLKKYPAFNALSLDYFWQNSQGQKLAGGTYCVEMKLDAEVVYAVNGFHPRQLTHFTEKGRSIVVFTLKGDLNWAEARQQFIGATNPNKAAEGSVRRTLLEHKDELGLPEVSQGLNGVHLSAGPVEGLIELVRYNSNFGNESQVKTYKDFAFGQTLDQEFSPDQVKMILDNADLNVDGKEESIFDLTEEKDSDEAVQILKDAM